MAEGSVRATRSTLWGHWFRSYRSGATKKIATALHRCDADDNVDAVVSATLPASKQAAVPAVCYQKILVCTRLSACESKAGAPCVQTPGVYWHDRADMRGKHEVSYLKYQRYACLNGYACMVHLQSGTSSTTFCCNRRLKVFQYTLNLSSRTKKWTMTALL